MGDLPYITQIVHTVGRDDEEEERRPVVKAYCAGCGDTILLPTTSAVARSTNLFVSGWRLVPGLGWVCESCARAVYNRQRSAAL